MVTPLVVEEEDLDLLPAVEDDCGSVPPEPAAAADEFCTSPPAKAGEPLGKNAFQSCNRCVVKLTGMAPLEEPLLDDAPDCDSEKDSEDLVACCERLVLRKLRISLEVIVWLSLVLCG